MLVVDTSAVLEALAATPPSTALTERLSADGDLHAPHLLDVEVLHALLGMSIRGEISDERAADARSDYGDLALVRYSHAPLADRIWELRDNMTAYDAAFVALAELVEAPLVTCDGRMAAAPGHRARIELFEVGAES